MTNSSNNVQVQRRERLETAARFDQQLARANEALRRCLADLPPPSQLTIPSSLAAQVEAVLGAHRARSDPFVAPPQQDIHPDDAYLCAITDQS